MMQTSSVLCYQCGGRTDYDSTNAPERPLCEGCKKIEEAKDVDCGKCETRACERGNDEILHRG